MHVPVAGAVQQESAFATDGFGNEEGAPRGGGLPGVEPCGVELDELHASHFCAGPCSHGHPIPSRHSWIGRDWVHLSQHPDVSTTPHLYPFPAVTPRLVFIQKSESVLCTVIRCTSASGCLSQIFIREYTHPFQKEVYLRRDQIQSRETGCFSPTRVGRTRGLLRTW